MKQMSFSVFVKATNNHCRSCQWRKALFFDKTRVYQKSGQRNCKVSVQCHGFSTVCVRRNFSLSRIHTAICQNNQDPNSLFVKHHLDKRHSPGKMFNKEFSTGHDGLLSEVKVDKYNGITIDLNDIPQSVSAEQFQHSLKESLQSWKKEGRTCIWIKVPIDRSSFIAAAAQLGFQFHHAEHQMSLLKLWLNTSVEDMTPRFATHQVGVSGMVYREDTKEILVVKDKNSQFSFWKLPGGLSDLEEDIGDTAVREVFEETGIKTEFLSVLAMRQQHQQPGAFGLSDIYFVCRLKPLTIDIEHCQNEISHCTWMDLEELYANSASISPITHRMCQLLLYGVHNGFSEVDILAEEMKSVYKGLKYKLYHRSL